MGRNAPADVKFGEDRLLATLEGSWQQPVREVKQNILDALRRFIGKRETPDDLTILVARVAVSRHQTFRLSLRNWRSPDSEWLFARLLELRASVDSSANQEEREAALVTRLVKRCPGRALRFKRGLPPYTPGPPVASLFFASYWSIGSFAARMANSCPDPDTPGQPATAERQPHAEGQEQPNIRPRSVSEIEIDAQNALLEKGAARPRGTS